jgi:hypothetical protein
VMLHQERQRGSNTQAPGLTFSEAQTYDFLHLSRHCAVIKRLRRGHRGILGFVLFYWITVAAPPYWIMKPQALKISGESFLTSPGVLLSFM